MEKIRQSESNSDNELESRGTKYSNLSDEELQEGITHLRKITFKTEIGVENFEESKRMIEERHKREKRIRNNIEEVKKEQLSENLVLLKELTYYELLKFLKENKNFEIYAPYKGITFNDEKNKDFLESLRTAPFSPGKYWHNNGDGLNDDDKASIPVDLETFTIKNDNDTPRWTLGSAYSFEECNALVSKVLK